MPGIPTGHKYKLVSLLDEVCFSAVYAIIDPDTCQHHNSKHCSSAHHAATLVNGRATWRSVDTAIPQRFETRGPHPTRGLPGSLPAAMPHIEHSSATASTDPYPFCTDFRCSAQALIPVERIATALCLLLQQLITLQWSRPPGGFESHRQRLQDFVLLIQGNGVGLSGSQ